MNMSSRPSKTTQVQVASQHRSTGHLSQQQQSSQKPTVADERRELKHSIAASDHSPAPTSNVNANLGHNQHETSPINNHQIHNQQQEILKLLTQHFHQQFSAANTNGEQHSLIEKKAPGNQRISSPITASNQLSAQSSGMQFPLNLINQTAQRSQANNQRQVASDAPAPTARPMKRQQASIGLLSQQQLGKSLYEMELLNSALGLANSSPMLQFQHQQAALLQQVAAAAAAAGHYGANRQLEHQQHQLLALSHHQQAHLSESDHHHQQQQRAFNPWQPGDQLSQLNPLSQLNHSNSQLDDDLSSRRRSSPRIEHRAIAQARNQNSASTATVTQPANYEQTSEINNISQARGQDQLQLHKFSISTILGANHSTQASTAPSTSDHDNQSQHHNQQQQRTNKRNLQSFGASSSTRLRSRATPSHQISSAVRETAAQEEEEEEFSFANDDDDDSLRHANADLSDDEVGASSGCSSPSSRSSANEQERTSALLKQSDALVLEQLNNRGSIPGRHERQFSLESSAFEEAMQLHINNAGQHAPDRASDFQKCCRNLMNIPSSMPATSDNNNQHKSHNGLAFSALLGGVATSTTTNAHNNNPRLANAISNHDKPPHPRDPNSMIISGSFGRHPFGAGLSPPSHQQPQPPFGWNAAAVGPQNRGKPRRGMMRRAVFSDNQRIGLEKRFQLQKYISKPDRKKLAEKLGLRDSQVKIWFQNRRMKWRNSKERELLSTGGSREQTLPTRNNPNPDLSDVGETTKRLAAAAAAASSSSIVKTTTLAQNDLIKKSLDCQKQNKQQVPMQCDEPTSADYARDLVGEAARQDSPCSSLIDEDSDNGDDEQEGELEDHICVVEEDFEDCEKLKQEKQQPNETRTSLNVDPHHQ